ncbi:hypothetical protein L596_016149 [Steinernema carpocapsae]|uniref:Uncharacterized protein n=1 Tax=Steinernema carpocapsae TaxID=34508 RepID=A0A4U5NI37_STECR|nr:hypothetical protein L596_016149 [Steinernema carpocapsae]
MLLLGFDHFGPDALVPIFVTALLPPLLFVGCLQRRAVQRDRLKQCKSLEVMPMIEMPDTGKEAWIRHSQQKWFPKLELQKESITNENFDSAKTRCRFTPHPKTAPKFGHIRSRVSGVHRLQVSSDFPLIALIFIANSVRTCAAESKKRTKTRWTNCRRPHRPPKPLRPLPCRKLDHLELR